MDNVNKTQRLISDLTKATSSLEVALSCCPADFEYIAKKSPEYNRALLLRDGVLMRFEYTFELSWKLMKALDDTLGFPCQNPRDCISMSVKNGLMEDSKNWLDYLKSRGDIASVYRKEETEELFEKTPKFLEDAKLFLKVAKSKVDSLKDS